MNDSGGHQQWGQQDSDADDADTVVEMASVEQEAPGGDEPVYRVRAVPHDRGWMVDVLEVGLAQAGRFGHVEDRARELISLRRGDDVVYRVEVEVDLAPSIRQDLETARRVRAEIAVLDRQAEEAMASAARQLLASTVSLRDAAQILGMPHQRLSALARAEAAESSGGASAPATAGHSQSTGEPAAS